jgi:hypothetical protein
MRIFIKMKEMLVTHKDMLLKIEQIEKHVTNHDARIKLLFGYLKKFIEHQEKPRTLIGFKKK